MESDLNLHFHLPTKVTFYFDSGLGDDPGTRQYLGQYLHLEFISFVERVQITIHTQLARTGLRHNQILSLLLVLCCAIFIAGQSSSLCSTLLD